MLYEVITSIDLVPGESKKFTIDFKVKPEAKVEYFLNVHAKLKKNWSLVEAGWILAEEP